MAIRGSCLCGGVSFEIDRVTGPVEICHCTRCRKTSGSSALVTVGVARSAFRLRRGRELIRVHAAPILYQPPAYEAAFCSRCGSPVPNPDAAGEHLEIPAGLFDDDPGVKPDKHIFVELVPTWDEIRDSLPRYTLRELYELRTGQKLPADFRPRAHAAAD